MNPPFVQAPCEPDPIRAVAQGTPHPICPAQPLPSPPLTTSTAPKKMLPELPLKIENADAVGVNVMPVGDADKSIPLKVAVVPDMEKAAGRGDDNDHETRVEDVTLHESQLSAMSPVTVPEDSA